MSSYRTSLRLPSAGIATIALWAALSASISLLPSPALAVPQISPVMRRDLSASALVGGLVVPERAVPLYFSPAVTTAGAGRTRRVKSVNVKEGQAVSAGQVLAELDGADLEQRLEDARSALNKALEAQRRAEEARRAQQAQLARLAAQLSSTEEQARQASSAAAQTQSACAQQASALIETAIAEISALPPPPPPPSLDSMPQTKAALAALVQCQANLAKASGAAGAAQATAELLSAQLDALRSSQAQTSAAGAQVSAARKSVDQAERMVKALTLRAPYDGIVAAVNVREGNTLPSSSPAIELRSEKLVVRADLAEGDLMSVEPGDVAEVTIRSARMELSASITSIAEDPRDSAGGPVTYPAYFDIPSHPSIKPGQLARIKILVETRRGVLAVPSSAVTEKKGIHYVVVVSDGKQEERRVIPGISDENYTEIVQGLQENEQVLTLAPRL